MKCWKPEDFEQKSLNGTYFSSTEMKHHLAGCEFCRNTYAEWMEEQESLMQLLYPDVLPASFTEGVMLSIGSEAEIFKDSIVTVNETKLHQARRFPKRWKLAAVVAALIVFISTATFFSAPTLADIVRSLFAGYNADTGLLKAQKLGLVQHPNIEVKDKGYMLKIDEAVADSTRVVVALQLFGPDGKHDRNKIAFYNKNYIFIKDENGNKVGEMYDYGSTDDFYYMMAIFPEPVQTDRLTVEGTIQQLRNTPTKTSITPGNWDFTFNLDLKEANKQTHITPLQGEYTSPDGMTVRLKRLTRMVQGVRLEFDTELSGEALKRSPGELWKEQKLSFHFEDLAGNEIHGVNTRKIPTMNSVMIDGKTAGNKPGLMHWSYTFKELPVDSPYKFVLDGYFVAETDGTSVELNPQKLKEEPIKLEWQGDQLLVKEYTVENPPYTNWDKPESSLHVTRNLRNEFSPEHWMIRTADGNEFTLQGRGAISFQGNTWKDGVAVLGGATENYKPFEFRFPALNPIPDKLTLIRTVVGKQYTNTDWKLELFEKKKGGNDIS
ncbi:DUF4179 domain-containing protein [Paenibacillus chitinolyticus]|uniref:DUF4179 domain-containing protein n=1 Tax=Paenibacillus chitinolyticus TaxID=79263 RepID=UPI003D023D60